MKLYFPTIAQIVEDKEVDYFRPFQFNKREATHVQQHHLVVDG